MRHAWTRLFRGLETFLMKRKNFFDNSFLVQILIKCGTWWPISKIGNPERTAAISYLCNFDGVSSILNPKIATKDK